MHSVSKKLILRMDSIHQIEMSKISTESGSSYKKRGKKRYSSHLCRLTPDVGALRNSSISGFFETDPTQSN